MVLEVNANNAVIHTENLVTGILAKISLETGIWAKFRLGTGIWYPPSRPSLQVSQWAPPHRTLEMAGKISPSCKWNGMFPFRSVATKKVEQLRRLSVCSGKLPLEPRIPFAFQPVELEISAKWKVPLIYWRSEYHVANALNIMLYEPNHGAPSSNMFALNQMLNWPQIRRKLTMDKAPRVAN